MNRRFAEGEIAMKRSEFSKEYDDRNLKLKQINYVADKQLLKLRKTLSEHPFGIVKRSLGADYLLMKRFSGVNAENGTCLFGVQYEKGHQYRWNKANDSSDKDKLRRAAYALFF